MKDTVLRKYGDRLLFALALAVLATALIRYTIHRTAAPAEKPAIVFTQWWENYPGKDSLAELVREFEKSHEGIKVSINTVSYEDMHRILLDPKEGAFPGDVFALDTLWVPELLKRGVIEPAQTSYPETPLLNFINVLYYNVDLLKEAGFSRPPKTRGEFTNYAAILTNREKGRFALTSGRKSSRGIYDDVFPWIWSAGAALIRDGEAVLKSRPFTDSLAFLTSLESGGFTVPGGASADTGKKIDDFTSGRAAFMIAPAIEIDFIGKQMGEEAFSVTSIPVPDNYSGKRYNASLGWTIGIYTGSARAEEARLFTGFIAGKAPALSEKLKASPGNGAPDLLHSKVWDMAIAAENAADFTGLPWEKLEEPFNRELSALFAGLSSPADTAAAIQKSWEEIIASF